MEQIKVSIDKVGAAYINRVLVPEGMTTDELKEILTISDIEIIATKDLAYVDEELDLLPSMKIVDYQVKFLDDENLYRFEELYYDNELGLAVKPLVTFKCSKCQKEVTYRTLNRTHKGIFDFRDKCKHEYIMEKVVD